LGTVLHTRSDGFAGTRSPIQIGAEIYGHSGAESDVEVLRLLMLTLAAAGIADVFLDLGHVGIYRGLARQAGLDPQQETALFEALQRKAIPEIESLVRAYGLHGEPARMLLALATLNGEDALERASSDLAAADPPVRVALDRLGRVANEMRKWLPDVPVHFDLAELRGYRYKTGVVFAAFVPGWGQEIARGGRYDDIGRVFGRARPAVGFSADLKGLLRLGTGREIPRASDDKVFAPWSADPSLQREIERLRGEGYRVIAELPGQGCTPEELGCTKRLLHKEGQGWIPVPVAESA
jgi:ATP phosphoribosyltransferase regulatory subunit